MHFLYFNKHLIISYTVKNKMRRPRGGEEVKFYSSFNLGSRWGGRSTPHLGRFTPGKDPIPIV